MFYNIDSSDFELFIFIFVFYFPKVLDALVDCDVICTPDAVEALRSLLFFLSVSTDWDYAFVRVQSNLNYLDSRRLEWVPW